MVAALSELGLMVDRAARNLELADRKISLVVVRVIDCVPQAPLEAAVDRKLFGIRGIVRYLETVELTCVAQRNKCGKLCGHAVLFAGEYGVAHAVTALIGIKIGTRGKVRGAPCAAAVLDVIHSAADIVRNVVVTETGNAAQLRVAVEIVAACGVRDQTVKTVIAQIVDPGQGRGGRGDDIFASVIIKIAVLHSKPPNSLSIYCTLRSPERIPMLLNRFRTYSINAEIRKINRRF